MSALFQARLQFARDQPIGWIGSIILPEGAVGGVVAPLEVAVEGLAHLIRRWPTSFSAAVAAAIAPGPTQSANAFSMASSTRRPAEGDGSEGRHGPSRPGCSCSAGCRAWRLCTSASACARSGYSGSAREERAAMLGAP